MTDSNPYPFLATLSRGIPLSPLPDKKSPSTEFPHAPRRNPDLSSS